MGKKITLGGDRVGSGNKMSVELHGYGRSTHNVEEVFRGDQAPGTLVPYYCNIGTNGTSWDINLATKVRTLPTNGPIFGSFKHQIDVYSIPIRLYIGALHNNALGIGLSMKTIYFPTMNYIVQNVDYEKEDLNSQQVSQSSLLAYIGIRGHGRKTANTITYTTYPAIFLLAYWDIYKNYYANKQEEEGAVISPKNYGVEEVTFTANYGSSVNKQNWKAGTTSIYNDNDGWSDTITVGAWKGTNATDTGFVKVEVQTRALQPEEELHTFNEIFQATQIYNWYGANREMIKPIGWQSLSELCDENTFSAKNNGTSVTYTAYFKQPSWNSDEQNTTGIKATVLATYEGSEGLQTNTNEIMIQRFPLKNIDKMREAILAAPKTSPFEITSSGVGMPYEALTQTIETNNRKEPIGCGCYYPQAGLGLKTYLSDRFNNWLNTETIEGENSINEITAVDVSDGKLTMDALILSKKLYEVMNRIAISGGSYNDWQEAVYGVRTTRMAESPMYEGGLSSEITFDEVVSSSESNATGELQPLGTLAGRGSDHETKGGQSIHVKFEEPSMLMIIGSITPRIDYSQGNQWWNQLKNMDQLHKPGLDGIGFQDLLTDEMAAFDTTVGENGEKQYRSVGKQPSWIEYMTSVNKTYGEFSAGQSLSFMALNRSYEHSSVDGHLKDATTYIDPTKYNVAFADAKLDARNFWVQVYCGVKARRVMSAKQIPNL